jgi:hypothetical protein
LSYHHLGKKTPNTLMNGPKPTGPASQFAGLPYLFG